MYLNISSNCSVRADCNHGDWFGESDESRPLTNVVLAMYGVICTVGITGNLLVCIVLLRVPSLRSNTSHFLIHLSIVDLLVCILVVPFKIALPLGQPFTPNPGFWGQLRCRVYVGKYPFWVCALTSVFSLVTVNVERFVAIVYPHKYKLVFSGRRNKLLIVALCWILASLSKSFILFLHDEDPDTGCRFLGWPNQQVQVVMGMYNFMIGLLVPFVLMVAVQWKIITKLRRQVRALSNRTVSTHQQVADRREIWQLRTTQTLERTLIVFALTFAVCWFPDQVMFLLFTLGVPLNFTSPLYHFGVILAVCNSCVNPVIYALTNQAFRRGIRETLRRRDRAARVGVGSYGSESAQEVPATVGTISATV